MKVTIIHKDGCTVCDAAIQEFVGDGHEVEFYRDLSEIEDADRRNDMMTDMLYAGGDNDKVPNVFVYDRFIPWRPKMRQI